MVLAGAALIEGFAEGTHVNIEYVNDLYTLKVGADGEGMYTKSNDLSATVTLTLMPGSAGNVILQSLFAADVIGNLGLFPLVITDPSTATRHVAKAARIMKAPTVV